jgi:hypothetical protein
MKLSSVISLFVLGICLLQVHAWGSNDYNQEDWGKSLKNYGGGSDYGGQQQSYGAQSYNGGQQQKRPVQNYGGYQQQKPKQNTYDDNFYNLGLYNGKGQSDSQSKRANIYGEQNLNQNDELRTKKSANQFQEDNYDARDTFKDDLYANKNTKARENDDLDQSNNALKFAKSNRNDKDQINKINYQDARDNLDQSSSDTVLQKKLNKNQSNQSKKSSTASHGEVDDREMSDSGLAAYGGHGESWGSNGAPQHQSKMYHQQQHDFGNQQAEASDSYLDSAFNNQIALSALKKDKRYTNFDKDDRVKLWNEDTLDFANQNANVKSRKNKDYTDSETNNRSVAQNKDLKKSNTNKANEDYSNEAIKSQNVQNLNKENENSSQDHMYNTVDTRAKEITNDNGNGYH